MYFYIKSLHIIFVVTWFAGLFYIVRLFIYNREAQDRPGEERKILQAQFTMMIRRLWLGITWPSCILTLISGIWLMVLMGSFPAWLMVKIALVTGLFLYHLSIQFIYQQQIQKIFSYSSQQLRLWNEVATLFLFAIVFLAVLKNTLSFLWGLTGLVVLIAALATGVKLYKHYRKN